MNFKVGDFVINNHNRIGVITTVSGKPSFDSRALQIQWQDMPNPITLFNDAIITQGIKKWKPNSKTISKKMLLMIGTECAEWGIYSGAISGGSTHNKEVTEAVKAIIKRNLK